MNKDKAPTLVELIQEKIAIIRGERVMLDYDLADLYGVETKQLKRAVRRNIERFPSDFMFELTRMEFDDLRSQFGTSNWGGTRYMPMVFTEQGVAMLSSVLNSRQAIEVNILIMRAFVKIRQMAASHKDLLKKINEMEKKYDHQFQLVFEAIRALMKEEEKPKRRIGFQIEEQKAKYKVKKSRR
ncbi:MAG: ORF6N domain-containing protein [Desulfobacteraceae bacterium]|jgi:hypothetical protein